MVGKTTSVCKAKINDFCLIDSSDTVESSLVTEFEESERTLDFS